MDPHDIQSAVKKARDSQAAMAARLHVTPSAVCQVIHGRSWSERIAREISRVTRISLRTLFPHRYPGRRQAA